jgi:hypothetical protein
MSGTRSQDADTEWVAFPGGELEGKRPRVLCAACRASLASGPPSAMRTAKTLCFQCYREALGRNRALRAAGQLDTSSEERFQSTLPFESIDRGRLDRLKAERADSRRATDAGIGRYANRRRQAQIAARHALHRLANGLTARELTRGDRARVMAAAIHAAELQLPASWLPFVISR